MKINIKKEEYKRIVSEEFTAHVPDTPVYYFQTGIRRAYAIIPVWTTWRKEHDQKEEEIYSVNIITVDPSEKSISAVNIGLSSFSQIILDNKNTFNRILENYLLYHEDNQRSKEQFMADYDAVLAGIASKLEANP